jgi:hypothetical protein
VAWTKYGPITGAGFLTFTEATNGLMRIFMSDTSGAVAFGGLTTPQRFGQTAWIATYDEVPSGDGIDDPGKYIGDVHWVQTEFFELDLVDFNTHIAGITGLAFGIFPDVALVIYTFSG